MKSNTDIFLKYAIQRSKESFIKNGYRDDESIENWLGQSLYYFYTYNNYTGFSRDASDALENVNREDILDFLINNYLEKINSTKDESIRDDFQNIIKNQIKSNGLEKTKKALSFYIKDEDTSYFPKESNDEILKYRPDSLLRSFSIISVKQVLGEKSTKIEKESKKTPKGINGIYASDFAVVSSKEYDIMKVVDMMSNLREGMSKISNIEDRGEIE